MHSTGRIAVVALLFLAAACGSGEREAGGAPERSSTSGPSGEAAGDASGGATTTTADGTTTASTAPSTTAAPTTAAPGGEDGPLVVLDPGHNGANGAHPEVINRPVDAGGFQKACNTTGTATDDGTTESSINWEVAQQVRDRLQAAGARVILTREDDAGVGPCIDERGRIAAEAGADLLVSIHADGAPPAARGFHVIHPGLRPGHTDGTVGPSAELAVAVRDALVAAGLQPSTYIGEDGLDERDDLGTLNRAGVPAVMVEAGNLRNDADAALLTSAEGQALVAGALADAALAFAAGSGGAGGS